MLENVKSFIAFIGDLVGGERCPDKPGLAQEEWFLRRAIRRNENRLADMQYNEWGEPVWWVDWRDLKAKLDRQRARLEILVKKRNGK